MKNTPISNQINFTTKIFGWTAVGLFVSGIIAFKLWQNSYLVQTIITNYVILGILVFGFIGFVIWVSVKMEEMDASKITFLFLAYSLMNGLVILLIFQFFTQNFIIGTFFILAGMFSGMSVLGYFTKQNLTSWASLIIMAILGIILNILLNFVWRKDNFQLITSAIAVFVFVGITAYDSKRMKEFNAHHEPQKAIIMGAFALSLNLYYLFIAIVFEANKGTSRING